MGQKKHFFLFEEHSLVQGLRDAYYEKVRMNITATKAQNNKTDTAIGDRL